jgi:hypothetical protein
MHNHKAVMHKLDAMYNTGYLSKVKYNERPTRRKSALQA